MQRLAALNKFFFGKGTDRHVFSKLYILKTVLDALWIDKK
jgi:hypothetical protein